MAHHFWDSIDKMGNDKLAKDRVNFKHVYSHILCVRVCTLHTVGWCHCFERDQAADTDVALQGLTSHTERCKGVSAGGLHGSWKMRWGNIWCICFRRHSNKPDSNPYADKTSLLPSCFLLLISLSLCLTRHTHTPKTSPVSAAALCIYLHTWLNPVLWAHFTTHNVCVCVCVLSVCLHVPCGSRRSHTCDLLRLSSSLRLESLTEMCGFVFESLSE